VSIFGFKVNLIASLTATCLSGLALAFFINILFPESLRSFGVIGQRWFSLSVTGLYLLFVYFFCSLHSNWSREEKIKVGLQSFLLTIFAFAYGFRLNGLAFTYAGLNLNTNLIFVPLIGLIWLVNYRLFDIKSLKLPLLLPQIGLLSLFIFSFLYFIDLDRTFLRIFGQDILAQIFGLPSIIWLILTSIGLTLITVLNLEIHTLGRNLIFTLIIFWLIFQSLLLLDTLNFLTYISKTLLFVIIWDFLFEPIKRIATAKPDATKTQIWIWAAYHALLFGIVIIWQVWPLLF